MIAVLFLTQCKASSSISYYMAPQANTVRLLLPLSNVWETKNRFLSSLIVTAHVSYVCLAVNATNRPMFHMYAVLCK